MITSALAAYFWYQASQVKAPPKALHGNHGWDVGVGVDATPLVQYAQDSGERNKIAALWGAGAALFTFQSWGLGFAHA